MKTSNYAQIVPLGAPIDREMTYQVPEDLKGKIETGSHVLIPFNTRWTTGIIVGFQDWCTLEKLKKITLLLDPNPVVSPSLLDLCRWIASYYMCPFSKVLKASLPAEIFIHSKQRIALNDRAPVSNKSASSRQRKVIEYLQKNNSATIRQLENQLGPIRGVVSSLRKRGLLIAYHQIPSPKAKTKQERIVEVVPQEPHWMDLEFPQLQRRAPKQAECILHIQRTGGSLPSVKLATLGFSLSILRALANRGLIRFFYREIRRDPYVNQVIDPPRNLTPTPHQEAALSKIFRSLDHGSFQTCLLHGITGSGKTLIYIQAAAHALKSGRGTLILVPEISLTPQTVRHFKSFFRDQVAVLHSALSKGERYDAWQEVREGKRQIVIGARSSVFAPIKNLGLIVVDEEHDSSYKQIDLAPRYNARDVAVMRAHLDAFPVILGSATPSLESYHNACIKKFHMISLPERIDSRPLPKVTLVDMKHEKGSIFSRLLRDRMTDKIQKSERIILLQNRRGYAPSVHCIHCGTTLQCPNCQVTLTYHAINNCLICHYCALTRPISKFCEACHGADLRLIGVGTQRVEEALNAQFPNSRVLRMDVDSTRGKGAHDQILETFRKGKADILLGTQMVSKGLDFHGVTLVGVISADTTAHLPDFRAGERTFQLLTQVSGRAGRGSKPGEVIIQTYLPEGEAVQCAKKHDFLTFAQMELATRKTLGYPPFERMAILLLKGPDEYDVTQAASICAETARRLASSEVDVLGPVQAPISRIRNRYRWQVILKTPSPKNLNSLSQKIMNQFANDKRRGITIDIDIDPVSLL